MAVDSRILEAKILKAFPNAQNVEVKDFVGDNNHYRVTIVDSSFKGLSILQQHRLVYNALQELLKEDLHAIDLITSHE